MSQKQMNIMPFFTISYYGGLICQYWQSAQYFFRRYDFEDKAKRISAAEYISAYEEYCGY